uniref:RGS domain-containing protein n=1 Tax=Electrophorus electricus TaxID=8005 RepID=A0A4W4DTS5_ELEEL
WFLDPTTFPQFCLYGCNRNSAQGALGLMCMQSLYIPYCRLYLPGPTLDEARLWAQSFEHLIKSARGRDHFRQFLKTEFSEENLLFWLACEELKKETNRTVVEQTVKQIYEDYISILSPREVSLDSRVRDVINKNMLEPSSQTFDDAQQQIYTLMQRDSYPRYMNSSMYAELIKSLETPDLPNES